MSAFALTEDNLSQMMKKFYLDSRNALAENVTAFTNPLDMCFSRGRINQINHVFSHKVDEVKPVTDQKVTGRCWLLAFLNCIRIPLAKQLDVEELELSPAYLFFWFKIERCNFVLNSIVDIYQRKPKETVSGRLMNHLLKNSIEDAGQWDMAASLVKKYGIMPKSCYKETFCSERSSNMNTMLKAKLTEFVSDLHQQLDSDQSEANARKLIAEQMNTLYRMVGIFLGIPPKEFTFEYYTKSKEYRKIGPISAQDFYRQYVSKHYDVEDQVCIVADPRSQNPTGRLYTIDLLGCVVEGKKITYNNQDIEVLIDLTAKSILDGMPVWFGSEMWRLTASKEGILDTEVVDYRLLFGPDFAFKQNKADRMIYGESAMNHAMLITGVHMEDGKPTKWRIENSWGEESNKKGYLLMTTDWFRECAYEIVVGKKYCSEDILKVMDQEPVVLPAWDPMGSLAAGIDNYSRD